MKFLRTVHGTLFGFDFKNKNFYHHKWCDELVELIIEGEQAFLKKNNDFIEPTKDNGFILVSKPYGFDFRQYPNGVISLCYNGKFLSANPNGAFNFANHEKAWERFHLIEDNDLNFVNNKSRMLSDRLGSLIKIISKDFSLDGVMNNIISG